MTHKSRRKLFLGSVALFILLGGGVSLYAQGWRIDFRKFSLTKVGAMYIRTYPRDAALSLDHKPVPKNLGLFDAGMLVNSLFPKAYLLEVTSPGYRTLTRTVEVNPALVAELKSLLLIPEEATITSSTPATHFWLIGDTLLTKTTSDKLMWRSAIIPGNDVLGWTANGARILTRDTARKLYFWTNLSDGSSTQFTSPQKLFVDRESETSLFSTTAQKISRITPLENMTGNLIASIPSSTTLREVVSSRTWTAWPLFNPHTGFTRIHLYDKFLGISSRASEELSGETIHIRWITRTILGIVQSDGGLYVYDAASDQMKKLASDVRDFIANGDGSWIAALEHRSLEVFELRGSGYFRFNLPRAEEVKTAMWYRDNAHIFIVYQGQTALLDLDDLSLQNFREVVPTEKSAYDPESNTLYFLEGNLVKKIEFPKQ